MTASVCLSALVAGACADDGEGGAANSNGAAEQVEVGRSGLLTDNGPCDASLAAYPVGTMTVFESPVLSLIDQVHAAEAAVEAFNSRGGVGGHCMVLTTCDTKFDPNGEVQCARELVEGGVVATLNDVTAVNPSGVTAITGEAGLPRVGVTPGPEELNQPNSYPLGAGAVGEVLAQVPTLARSGHKKIAIVHLSAPVTQGLRGVIEPMLDAYGAEVTAMIPVAAGTTDYQQFILVAAESGADGVMLLLGEAEAVQVIRAAEQLASDLVLASGLTAYPHAAAEDLGEFASRLVFNSEVPPITASLEEWPILADVIADLSASGEPALQRDEISSSSFRSWLAVYALVRVVETFGNPDDISRNAVTTALAAATDVDFFGIIPPWTPSSGSGEGLLGSVSNPYYYQAMFDPATSEFVIDDEQINIVEEFDGNLDYPQPPAR
ncbi:MAG TPA: ABC transporter substrate-binding protein [Microthrixaceae bacterium]|nr:ABC transporter substrate-binding protein [Microthrixaceae bacterium]